MLEIVVLPSLPNTPVGLVIASCIFYLAENETVIVHSIGSDGNLLGSWDFSNSGIHSISGIATDVSLLRSTC
ncbi:MAG: hypothetical protein KAR40_01490 [Candidatus Sabulitectum sp.]|nr:hypothetical protein [Candidatus Sabulitectum sp.]